MPKLRDEKIATARKLRQEGSSLKEIANELGVSRATASFYCRNVLPKGANSPDPRLRKFGKEIKELYVSGVPISEIARRLNIPAPTIYDWRRRLGIQRNSRKTYVTDELRKRISVSMSPDNQELLTKRAIELYVQKQYSTPDIANELGVSAVTIATWLERAGIDRRKSPTKQVREKLRKANLGEKRYNWKGGITGERRRQRLSMYMRDAREACFRRDDYTCRACGQRGGKLNAHHVWPFQRFPELKYEVSNLVTLCRKCHDAFHKAAGGPVKVALGPFFAKRLIKT
jgi:transposase